MAGIRQKTLQMAVPPPPHEKALRGQGPGLLVCAPPPCAVFLWRPSVRRGCCTLVPRFAAFPPSQALCSCRCPSAGVPLVHHPSRLAELAFTDAQGLR